MILRLGIIFFLSLIFFEGRAQLKSNRIKLDNNKNIPEILREGIKDALSFYPELKDTKIDFVLTNNIKHSYMQAQPKWYGVFQNKKNRAYLIKIKPYFDLQDQNIPVSELPYEILVGWIGHELGHILDYVERSSLNMMGFGVNYVTSKRKMIEAENRADINAIEHGLGKYILSCKKFVLTTELFSKDYRNRINKHYMSPEEVVKRMGPWQGIVSVK